MERPHPGVQRKASARQRYAHACVREVIRTGPQTLSVYWLASQQKRIKRGAHRAYRLRE